MATENLTPTIPVDFISQVASLGVISLKGEEAVKYLQGQVTANVETLSEANTTLGCHCDFKGKVWSVLHILKDGDDLICITHTDSHAASLPELKKFGVFSKVDIEDDTDNWQILGGRGEKLEQWLQANLSHLPSEHFQRVSNDQFHCIRIGDDQPRYLLLMNNDAANALKTALSDVTADPAAWEVLDIVEGLANVQGENINAFVPQMLNMQALDAIDFTKGCYLGQEVVARTKYLGKNKRASFLLTSDNDGEITSGDTLEIQMGENWRRGGTVLRAARWQERLWVLAVLANDTESSALLRAKATPELHLSLLPLPYTIEE